MFDLDNNQTIWLIIGGILILTVIFGVYMVQKTNQSDQVSGGETVDINIGEDEWTKGAENPQVTLVEYGDFQCPACKSYQPVLSQLVKNIDGLRLVFRHFPLVQVHKNALKAARAAEAAGLQGEFWAMHDKLFENQKEWGQVGSPQSLFVSYAEEIGLDTEQFKQDYNSDKVEENVRSDMRSASEFNLQGTPSFIVGNKVLDQLPRTAEKFANIINQAKKNQEITNTSSKKQVHKHADIAVYINNRKIDLSKPKYQSDGEQHQHKYSHHHDQVGHIIHQHKDGIPLSEHFKSLGMKLTNKCFQLDNGAEYCSNENKSLKAFVNGERITNPADYVFEDLDRILISYGPLTGPNIEQQLDSVTDEACIYSKECPERGDPPEESCVGGLGTKCKGAATSSEK
ncbi:MAG: DsbA family protein [Candidatus Paceibacteria bacterium]